MLRVKSGESTALGLVAFLVALLACPPNGLEAGPPEGLPTDLGTAKKQAAEEGKPILLEITRSEGCWPCRVLERDVLDTEKFTDFAEENLILFYVDIPNDRSSLSEEQFARNLQLARDFEVGNVPTLLLLNAEGEEIARHTGYKTGQQDAIISMVEQAVAGSS